MSMEGLHVAEEESFHFSSRMLIDSTHLIAATAAWLQHFSVVALAVDAAVEHAVSQIDEELFAGRAFEAARMEIDLKEAES
jgi:hypothetical protein